MNYKSLLILSLILSFLVSCKSTRSVSGDGSILTNMSARKLINFHETNEANFNTLQAKVKIEFIQDLEEQSYTVNLRMDNGKAIWLNSAFSVVRAMITPNKVQFYNKLDNEYFDGDYLILSDLLGIELNYEKVENLLLGNSMFELSARDYKLSDNETSYILQPNTQDPLIELFLLFNPSHFKMDSQQLSQPLKKRFLQVDYESYQEVEKQIIPEKLKIIALEESDEVRINLEFKSVSLNEDLRFPFNIPSGFKEIKIDDK